MLKVVQFFIFYGSDIIKILQLRLRLKKHNC